MIQKPFDQINKNDIDALIENAVQENKTLEYKESLSKGTDKEKKEFLADVSSFANASGGDIIFGIKDKRKNGKPTGIPEAATGLSDITADSKILQLESIIRDGLSPRISGLQIKAVDGFSDGPVIIVRIPKSWTSPHMVVFKNHSRFYSRNSAGKHQLDVAEIRSAFALSDTVAEKVRLFRDDRLIKIIADETPIPLGSNPKVIVHLIPLTAFDISHKIDISLLNNPDNRLKLRPLTGSSISWNHRNNIDGLVTFTNYSDKEAGDGYVQVFRSGIIEAVSASLIITNEHSIISITGIENRIIERVDEYLSVLLDMEISPPIVVLLSVFGAEGYSLQVRPGIDVFQNFAIDRELLLLPDLLIEDISISARALLRPVFDAVWQAAGFVRCMDYDEDGTWIYSS